MDLINLQPNLYRTQVNLGSNLWVRVGGALQQPVEAMGEGSTDARDGAAGDPHTALPLVRWVISASGCVNWTPSRLPKRE